MVGKGEQEQAAKRDTRALEVYPHPSTRNWGLPSSPGTQVSRNGGWRPLSEGFDAVMHDPF